MQVPALEHVIIPASVAHAMLVLAVTIALGLIIGQIRVAGVSLGIAGVLFAGLLFGHFRPNMPAAVLDFVRDLGLVFFVYTIGIQVGPGFLASFRRHGLGLNATSALIVVLGCALTVALQFLGSFSPAVLVGLLSGAVTNTPSLAAVQQALPPPDAARAGMAYALAYPFGILGVILTMVLVRRWFRVDLTQETEAFQRTWSETTESPVALNLEIRNPGLDGQPLRVLSELAQSQVVFSRLWRKGACQVPTPATLLQPGDVLLAVGTRAALDKLRVATGGVSSMDLREVGSNLASMRILVTKRSVLGRSVGSLPLYGATMTRVFRAGVEFVAAPGVRLQFGDTVTVVGDETILQRVADELGNSPRELNHPNILPIFIGIVLGIVAGNLPLHLPGLTQPIKLGLAGGPLLVAILLSRLGNIGPVSWYLPHNANLIVREIGIALFLACVGLQAGEHFLETIWRIEGLYWLAAAATITLIPVLSVALLARAVWRTNYLVLCGLLAGSMTDPPALSFANTMTRSDAPAVTYATVYPLTMFLRVTMAQVLITWLTR
ncbi:MAG: putative transporter [Verrucomicrobiae bacterium]|nr:putative transporter [Verrucomicrobiae bacterium]